MRTCDLCLTLLRVVALGEDRRSDNDSTTAIAIKILSAHKSNCSKMVQALPHWVVIRSDDNEGRRTVIRWWYK